MRIAVYAPLKSPHHPVVSGDREMARLLIAALEHAGHTVETASELRAYLPRPENALLRALRDQAEAEIRRLREHWQPDREPQLWFTYHPYYKAPDLIGPAVAAALSIPYVTAEASLSSRRNEGAWAASQAAVAAAVRQASVNLCLTRRDHDGLARNAPAASLAMLPAFIDPAPFGDGPAVSHAPSAAAPRLLTVAMMRPGDKLASYRMLAAALALLVHLPWTLTVVGDGPARPEVETLFERFDSGRVSFHGRLEGAAVAALLGQSNLYLWPGCGEAFGLAYLEAQAAGVPVVAQATAGVPEVVRHGDTGLLTPDLDVAAYADAIAMLLANPDERRRLGANARRFVRGERSLAAAAARLAELLPATAAA